MSIYQSNVAKRARRVLDIAKRMAEANYEGGEQCSILNRLEEIQLHFSGYSEPGYDVGKSGIVATSNWNNVDKYVPACDGSTWGSRVDVSNLPSRICEIFEKMGIEVEWSDEWITCADCGKLVRTQGDSYCWQASFVEVCGEVQCHECVKSDPEEHLTRLEGDYRKANTISDIDPSDYGYVKVEECEAGWHNSHDNPKDVARKVEREGVERYLFNIDSVEQFRTMFSLWVHEDEIHLLNKCPTLDDNECSSGECCSV